MNALTFLVTTAVALTTSVSGSLFAESVKSAGMGRTSMALPQDTLSVYKNPSQAAEIDRRADIAFTYQETDKKLEISNRELFLGAITQSGTFHPVDDKGYFPEAGVNVWLNCQLAVGVAYNEIQHIKTHYQTPLTDFSGITINGDPAGTNAALDYQVGAITTTAAYRLNDCNSIGVSVNIYHSTFKVNGLQGIDDLSINAGRLSDQGNATAWGVGYTLGWTGSYSDWLAWGLSVTPRVKMDDYGRYSGFLANKKIDLPTVVRAGVAWYPRCDLVIALDAGFYNYNKVRALNNGFISDSTTGLGPLFGEKHGPGFGWRDQWTISVGAEWAATECLNVRAGYRHESLPWRGHGTRTALNVFTLNNSQDFVSLGGTWTAWQCSELSVFGEYGFEHTNHARFPSNFTGATVNFLSGDLAMTSHLYRLGAAYGIRF